MVMIWTVGTGFALNLILEHLYTILMMALFCATFPLDGERQILAAILGTPQWGLPNGETHPP